MKINLIGKGNVACNLQHAFAQKGMLVEMYSSRENLNQLPEADVYIYAVRDEALAQVVSQVKAPLRAMHVHTSGTMPIDVFGLDKPHAGIFYPFQTFSKASLIEDFSRVPIFIEGRNIDDISAIYTLAQYITPIIYEANQADRERLHVAGVFANNFTNQMYAIAAEILRGTHIPFVALLPLIDQTAAKIHKLSPEEAQTGPARRGDKQVMAHHQALLNDPEQRQLYELVSRMIEKKNASHE